MIVTTRNGSRKEDSTVLQVLDDTICQQKKGINLNKSNRKKKLEALRWKKNLV